MPNSKTHIISGTIVGAVAMLCITVRKGILTPIRFLVGLAVSALVSRLPDILEPATSPNHRGFFHSVVFFVVLTLLCMGIWKKFESVGENGETKQITLKELLLALLFVGLLCVMLHLLLDSFTKKSLPIL